MPGTRSSTASGYLLVIPLVLAAELVVVAMSRLAVGHPLFLRRAAAFTSTARRGRSVDGGADQTGRTARWLPDLHAAVTRCHRYRAAGLGHVIYAGSSGH
jgi:hypothetical protein